MIEKLQQLGFSEKEAVVYMALLEYGTQPASVIAKKVKMPKATVLFLFENLYTQGYLQRSQKGRTFYFYADPRDLKKEKEKQLQHQQKELNELLPLLKEFKSPFTSPPKLLFFEGLEGCQKAYSLLLESQTPIDEFAAHDDLEKMGKLFMKEFIEKRVERNIQLRAVCKKTPLHSFYHRKNKGQLRQLKMFSPDCGDLYSSIAIFENKVLLLNLYHDAFALLIENEEFTQSLKTIFELAWNGNKVK